MQAGCCLGDRIVHIETHACRHSPRRFLAHPAPRPLQAGLVYRAVKLHMRMHNWGRALEVAQKAGRHIDAVLLARAAHLAARREGESLDAFKRAAADQGPIDAAAVAAVAAEEKRRERERSGGGGGRAAVY